MHVLFKDNKVKVIINDVINRFASRRLQFNYAISDKLYNYITIITPQNCPYIYARNISIWVHFTLRITTAIAQG